MENKKSIIINVGRQIGSGGHIIATMLAEDFNCKVYDRELLNLAAKESGFSEKFFEQIDEKKSFMKTLFHTYVPFMAGDYYDNTFSQESLFKFQSDAIRKAADEGTCIFVGRCADYVLRDHTNMVSTFITANFSDRVKRVSERKSCDKETAKKFINSGESDRSEYYNYYTGKKWGHCASYDLCVNTSILGLEETEKYIASFVRKKFNME